MESMLYPRMTASRRAVSLDGMWKVRFDFLEEGMAGNWQNGFESDDLIPVPASFNDFYTEKKYREFAGDIWYETEVVVPEEWKDKEIAVRFGAATHRAEVYFNGVEVARHEGGFVPFLADVTSQVRWNEKNRIVVKVNNELFKGSLPNGSVIEIPQPEGAAVHGKVKMVRPAFDFFNYAGLQRPVWLLALPKTSIDDFTVVHELEGEGANVSYQVAIRGSEKVETKLFVYDEAGNQVAAASGTEGVISIHPVRLWNVRDAYLYRFVIRLEQEGRLIDEYEEEIGIRTIEIKGIDILLNGKPVYLKGFGKHEDSDIVGRGYAPGVIKRDFELMKWIGANSFRTSHYPYSEEIYQMADREGFLVIDEVAAVGFLDFGSLAMFMGAGAGMKAKSFFEGPEIETLKTNHLNAIKELIQRDKNHACVIAWSLFNEPETSSEAASRYFGEIFKAARENDPQKRPLTFAMEKSCSPENAGCHQYCDFLTINRYYGWYIKGGYEIAAAEVEFRQEMDAWGALELQRPMVFTEYGTDTYPSEHKLPSVMWSQEYQVEMLEMCSRVFDSYEFIKGEQIWNFADFQTVEGTGRVNGNKKGVFTRQRQPKESAFFLKKRWETL